MRLEIVRRHKSRWLHDGANPNADKTAREIAVPELDR